MSSGGSETRWEPPPGFPRSTWHGQCWLSPFLESSARMLSPTYGPTRPKAMGTVVVVPRNTYPCVPRPNHGLECPRRYGLIHFGRLWCLGSRLQSATASVEIPACVDNLYRPHQQWSVEGLLRQGGWCQIHPTHSVVVDGTVVRYGRTPRLW